MGGHAERSNDYVVAKLQKDLATLSQSYAKEVSQLKLRQSDVELAASIINEENLRQAMTRDSIPRIPSILAEPLIANPKSLSPFPTFTGRSKALVIRCGP